MIWSSVKKKSFLWRNGSKVKIWGTYHLPLNKCECFDELELWKSQHCPLDDCPYDWLIICEIKKNIYLPMSKLFHCLSTNLQPYKELWLLWTRFGPFHVLCATPGLGSQAPPECVSCKNSINEEWLLQLQLVQCLSAGPSAQPRSALLAPRALRRLATVLEGWCKFIIVTKWARHDAFYDYIPTTFCLLRLLTYYVLLLYILGTLKSASQKMYYMLWGIFLQLKSKSNPNDAFINIAKVINYIRNTLKVGFLMLSWAESIVINWCILKP